MTTVSLNETKLVKDASGQHIYIDSTVLARALQGATIGTISYAPVDLSGVQILGLGVTSGALPTKITRAQVVASLPSGLYPTSVKLTVDKDVVLGDGNFYLVGGEILLNNYIM
jgi:hypothetical protein